MSTDLHSKRNKPVVRNAPLANKGCKECAINEWMCLSCGNTIPYQNFHQRKNTSVAVYCDCCDHSYVCRECYALTPETRVWETQFGSNHCPIDLLSEPDDVLDPLISILLSGLLFSDEI